MTERGRADVARTATSFSVGPSALEWDGNALTITIDERCAFLPMGVRGRVRVTPEVIGTTAFELDDGGRHIWHPLAPRAHVEADFNTPGVRWSGSGYFDSNMGDEPLEDGFVDWQWSRAHLASGDVGVIYEGARRDGTGFDMALRCDRTGFWSDEPLPPRQHLLPTPFGIGRKTRVDAGAKARVIGTWLDSPFYARSALSTHLFGEPGVGVHESLKLDRLVSPAVQWMLPWRMPRVVSTGV